MTLLADPSGEAAKAFGMLSARDLARVAVFHIDAQGVVRHRWLPDTYRDPPTAAAILDALG